MAIAPGRYEFGRRVSGNGLGDLFDTGGDGVQGLCHPRIGRGRLDGTGRSLARASFLQFIGQDQPGHQKQAQLSDMAYLGGDGADVAGELGRQLLDAILLSVGTSDGVGAAIDLDGDGGHQALPSPS